MKTYNTYQEAKIANPDSDIFVYCGSVELIKGKFQAIKDAPTSHFANGWELCSPADYCMTVEQFLKSGHKFAEGDKYLFSDGYVGAVTVGGDESKIRNGDASRYILRAKALEKPKQDEWKNGDECVVRGESYIFGCVNPKCDQDSVIVFDDVGDCFGFLFNELSRPETPEQKEGRERLEDIEDIANFIANLPLSELIMPNILAEKIIDKTNYRIGKSQ